MAVTIAMISLGCAKNLINSEQMLCLLNEAGYRFTDSPDGADVAVVNTCGFIESAKMEAIDNIIELGALKKAGKLKKIVVAGCLAQRYQEELMTEMPEIDALVGVGSFDRICDVVAQVLAEWNPMEMGDIDAPLDETGRVLTTGPSWAYIKIADGCDNRCAYCVIPALRGRFRSRPMDRILEEARTLAASGIRELIVIAQDITRYGTDLDGKRHLAELLRALCAIPELEWIRLHYLYPDEIDDELIDVIAGEKKILHYLDIPIQHINDAILKRMNRRGTGGEIRALFRKLRARMPDLVLRTSLIAGLPGEGEAEFEELCDFLREAKIQRAGVFPYSPEEGTPAADMERPDEDTANRRAELILDLQSRVMDEFNQSRIGTVERVLCLGYDRISEYWFGRSYAESPDVDGLIWFTGKGLRADAFFDVLLTGDLGGDMVGEKVGDE